MSSHSEVRNENVETELSSNSVSSSKLKFKQINQKENSSDAKINKDTRITNVQIPMVNPLPTVKAYPLPTDSIPSKNNSSKINKQTSNQIKQSNFNDKNDKNDKKKMKTTELKNPDINV